MRPTTKDLAKEAGVSLATVDRVLNERSGVRKATISKVNDAIEKIGFVRDLTAANLARKRDHRLAFVLPDSDNEFMSEILAKIDEAGAVFLSQRVQTQILRVQKNDAHAISVALDRIDANEIDGVAIMAPATPQLRDAINRLRSRNIQVVAFISKQPNTDPYAFIGIDNVAAGRTAGRLMARFTRRDSGSFLVICETMQSLDNIERRFGFDEIVNRDYPQFSILPSLESFGDPKRARTILRNTLLNTKDLAGLYVMSSDAEHILRSYEELSLPKDVVTLAHERTAFTEAKLRDGMVDAVITQDSGHIVRSALRVLKANLDNTNTIVSQENVRIEILVQDNL